MSQDDNRIREAEVSRTETPTGNTFDLLKPYTRHMRVLAALAIAVGLPFLAWGAWLRLLALLGNGLTADEAISVGAVCFFIAFFLWVFAGAAAADSEEETDNLLGEMFE